MRNRIVSLVLGVWVIAGSGSPDPVAGAETGLNAAEALEAESILAPLAAIEVKKAELVRGHAVRYVSDLKIVEAEIARADDLDGLVKVRAERESWERGEPTAAFDPGTSATVMKARALRYSLDKALATLNDQAQVAWDREKATALEALARLEGRYTRAMRVPPALAVRAKAEELRVKMGPGTAPTATVAGAPGAVLVQSTPAVASATAAALPPGAPSPSGATKERPFVNSLGMRFVPIPNTTVLFSVWETRVADWNAFLQGSGYAWKGRIEVEQPPDHPVANVSWNDAKAFCEWLSKNEAREYRLPTDEEWGAAAGGDKYPWGDKLPPPRDAGNFSGEESKLGDGNDPDLRMIHVGWRDAHPRIAPVGSYRANKRGLFDLAGNVWEFCEDWYTESIYKKHRTGGSYDFASYILTEIAMGDVRRVSRGGSWFHGDPDHLLCVYRLSVRPEVSYPYYGFRCVLVAVRSR